MRYSLKVQLTQAIRRDGRSLYAIAKAAGIAIGPLQRFMAKQHGATLDTADKLAKALRLRIVLREDR